MPFYWTDEQFNHAINSGEPVVCLGQISPQQRRKMERWHKKGKLLKWRGYWNTHSPHFGIGPLKTIFARPLPLEYHNRLS